jgi:TrmH family RNA methyltransferase
MIDSPANPVVKSMKALFEAKTRRARRQFVVEGVRSVEDGLGAGFSPDVCLYNTELLTRTQRGSQLLRKLNALPPSTLFEVSPRAMQAATDTEQSQGIVAAFPFVEPRMPSRIADAALVLICDNISDPGNLGTLLRTAEAAGVHAVWTTPQTVDIYNPKVVRAAMGTHFRLAIYAEQSWDSIVQKLSGLGISSGRLFCTEAGASRSYDEIDWSEPSGIVISNEAHGLTLEARRACGPEASISVPMATGTESLNAAIAGAVIMFEASRQRRQAKPDAS